MSLDTTTATLNLRALLQGIQAYAACLLSLDGRALDLDRHAAEVRAAIRLLEDLVVDPETTITVPRGAVIPESGPLICAVAEHRMPRSDGLGVDISLRITLAQPAQDDGIPRWQGVIPTPMTITVAGIDRW